MASLKIVTSLGAVFLVCALCTIVRAETTMKKCFKGTDKEPEGQVDLTCPPGHVISVTEALVGKNEWLECLLTSEDCTHPTKAFKECDGRNTCNKTFRTYSAICGYITILYIIYDCRQVEVPTPRATSVTPPNQDASDGFYGEGQDARDPDRGGDSYPREQKADSSNDEDEQEIGLLVATVLASLITGVMLVIAILMTIRRLLNYPMRMQRRHGEAPSRFTLRLERACFHVDKLPCFSGLDSLEDSSDQPPNAGIGKTSAVGTSLSCEEQHVVAAESPPHSRMTPIGQESSDNDMSQSMNHPELGQDTEDEGSNDNLRHAQGSGNHKHAQEKGRNGSGRYAQAQTSIECEDIVPKASSSLRRKQKQDIKNMSLHTPIVNSNENKQIYLDKTVEWDEKSFNAIKSLNNNNTNNNNNNTILKSNLQGILVSGIKNGVEINEDDAIEMSQKHCGCPVEAHSSTTQGCDESRTMKPVYNAIVVPNTETSSKC